LNFSISMIFAFVFYELHFVVAPVVLKLLIGKKVPFNFHLTHNNGESTLRVGYCKSEIDRKGNLIKKKEKGLIIRFQIEILIFLNF